VAGALEVVAALLFAYLVVVVPIRGRSRYERFRYEITRDPSARLRYYRRSLVWKYVLSLVVVALLVANHPDTAGIRVLRSDPTTTRYLGWLVVCVALGGLFIRWRARRPASRMKLARAIRGFADLLPQTAAERRMWVAVAITAGVTEELLYRGFVLWVLAQLLPGADTFTLLVAGGVIFGLAHLYQGTKGVALTALVGVVLGEVMITAGLLPAMVIHALIDLRVLLIPPDFMARALHAASEEPATTDSM
jgi:membrane protease YdiL (CAAX protease family)